VRIRPFAVTAVAAALAVTTGGPSYAGTTASFTITVSPTSLHPGESTNVSGDTAGPACANDGVAVTLTFTKPDGSTGTATVNTTTNASGHFDAVAVTVPDTAVAGEPASVQAVIADCSADSGNTRASDPTKLTILAYEGSFTTNKGSGKPGTTVHVAGTNCWGGDVVVVFTDGANEDEVAVTLKSDKTFSGDYVVPDAPGGNYAFQAQCPGTDYAPRAFLLVNPAKPPAPAPKPIVRPVHFTG
jgi:hypothetical protein